MIKIRYPVLFLILIIVIALLQYRLWFESDGIFDMIKMKNEIAEQETFNKKIKARNDELLFQVQRLQNSKDSDESRARNELGMIKKDETFYQVITKDK